MSRHPYGAPLKVGHQFLQTERGEQVVTAKQSYVARYHAEPDASADDAILETVPIGADDQRVFEAEDLDGQPDVARNIAVQGNSDAETAEVTITGKDLKGDEVTETITVPGTGADPDYYAEGDLAFAEVTKIEITDEADGEVSVGVGPAIGLPAVLDHNTVLFVFENDAEIDASDYTLSTDDSDISENTYEPDTDNFDGSRPLDIYLLVPTGA